MLLATEAVSRALSSAVAVGRAAPARPAENHRPAFTLTEHLLRTGSLQGSGPWLVPRRDPGLHLRGMREAAGLTALILPWETLDARASEVVSEPHGE
jgi:hypothetical protein